MAFRLLLGGLFLYSGSVKLFNLVLFKATILSYYAMPDFLALVIAIVFPWVEILAGLSLAVNWKTLYSSGFIFILTIFFFVQMILNYSNILPYGCGCFGFGSQERISIYHIVRDFIIAALAGFVFRREYRLYKSAG